MNTLAPMNWKDRWLQRMPWITIVVGVLIISMIASGHLDPRPAGYPRWTQSNLVLAVSSDTPTAVWLEPDLPSDRFSIRLSAALASGEDDIGYGLVIRDSRKAMVISLSPMGYVSIRQENLDALGDDGEPDEMMQWQPWPHINTGSGTNEIWIDANGRRITVRVNRELLWSGSVAGQWQQAGVWTESFGKYGVVDFTKMELFSP